MLIGQVAEISGVAAATLRYYEANGLLESERDGRGYRCYDISTLQRLTRIRALRAAGWSITDIGELDRLLKSAALGGEVCRDELAGWIQQLDNKLVALRRVRFAIESILIESFPELPASHVGQDLDFDLD